METRIKERLTGALILVAALVILVPEIFSGRHINEPSRGAPPAAPATEGPPLRSYVTETGAANPPPIETRAASANPPAAAPVVEVPSPPRPAPAAVSRPADKPEKPSVDKPVTEKPGVEKPVVEKPREAKPASPQSAPAPAPAAPPSAGDWFVQVGSFSQTDNAERYAQQLRKQGFSPVVLPPAGSKGLVRVRVGPVRSRDAATALLERLTANGHKGAVVGS